MFLPVPAFLIIARISRAIQKLSFHNIQTHLEAYMSTPQHCQKPWDLAEQLCRVMQFAVVAVVIAINLDGLERD